jgi:WD40 repeat protein
MRGIALALVGVLQAVGSVCAADVLPPGAVLRLGETRFRAGGEVRHLRFSADGTIVLGWTVGRDGQLVPMAWDVETGAAVASTEHRSPPDLPERSAAAAKLRGDRIVTAGPGNAGRIWDASTKRQLAQLTGHASPITAVAVSDDGARIATGSADGLIKLWDAETFRPLNALHGHTGVVRAIHISGDGSRALTLGDDRSARVWDLRTGRELRGFPTAKPAGLTSDGNSVVLVKGERSDEVLVRDVVTGLEVIPERLPALPMIGSSELLSRLGIAFACSPDGRTIAMARRDGAIGLYEAATGQLRRMLPGHGAACSGMAFTPSGDRLLTASTDHSVLVWAVRVKDFALTDAIKRETRAGVLWTSLTAGRADAACLALARFAAEPPAAVKMARLQLHAANADESDAATDLASRRAVELLEVLDTNEARDFLAELAGGYPTATLTRESQRALRRLEGR